MTTADQTDLPAISEISAVRGKLFYCKNAVMVVGWPLKDAVHNVLIIDSIVLATGRVIPKGNNISYIAGAAEYEVLFKEKTGWVRETSLKLVTTS